MVSAHGQNGSGTVGELANVVQTALPTRVEVRALVSSRYADNTRPLSWDMRIAGRDLVETADGRTIPLLSDGQQSPPKAGWVLLLTGGSQAEGYRWTLYGIRPQTVS